MILFECITSEKHFIVLLTNAIIQWSIFIVQFNTVIYDKDSGILGLFSIIPLYFEITNGTDYLGYSHKEHYKTLYKILKECWSKLLPLHKT